MVKTKKNRIKKSVTKKNKKMIVCPIGLKPFEYEFGKKISPNQLRLSSSKNKQNFVKQLLSKFAPNSIKPENDFYDYINYQWLKNVSLEEQQKYIVQIDDFPQALAGLQPQPDSLPTAVPQRAAYPNLPSQAHVEGVAGIKQQGPQAFRNALEGRPPMPDLHHIAIAARPSDRSGRPFPPAYHPLPRYTRSIQNTASSETLHSLRGSAPLTSSIVLAV
jgi:hypothetical protein